MESSITKVIMLKLLKERNKRDYSTKSFLAITINQQADHL